MEWGPFLDDGSIVPFENGRDVCMERIRDSWDGVVRARACYMDSHYGAADVESRQAMAIASEALCFHYGYRPAEPATFEFSERMCKDFFVKRMAEGIFERAHMLHDMLPLPDGPLPPEQSALVRRSVAASSELAALVESFIYM
jgi:hypothetical protein